MPKKTKPRGGCYHTAEALFILLGGRDAGYVPHYLHHEGDTHWYLVHYPLGEKDNNAWGHNTPLIIDPTVSQFKTKPDYSKGRGCGFLTKRPSKKAKELMKRLVWQNP